MEKHEILEKSRMENQPGDERDRSIQQKSNQAAYCAILLVNAALITILFLQKFFTGTAFADYRVFFLAVVVSAAGKNMALYFYYRRRSYLVWSVVSVLCSLSTIFHIVLAGMDWV